MFSNCRDFGTIGENELSAASLALASIDHVLILGRGGAMKNNSPLACSMPVLFWLLLTSISPAEEDGLNDIVMRAGMGWSSGLRNKRWRWYEPDST